MARGEVWEPQVGTSLWAWEHLNLSREVQSEEGQHSASVGILRARSNGSMPAGKKGLNATGNKHGHYLIHPEPFLHRCSNGNTLTDLIKMCAFGNTGIKEMGESQIKC